MTTLALQYRRHFRHHRPQKIPEQVSKDGFGRHKYKTREPQRVLGSKGQRDRLKAINVMKNLLSQIASSGNFIDELKYMEDIQAEASSNCSNQLLSQARNTFANVLKAMDLGEFAFTVRRDEDLVTKLNSVTDNRFVRELERSIAQALCA